MIMHRETEIRINSVECRKVVKWIQFIVLVHDLILYVLLPCSLYYHLQGLMVALGVLYFLFTTCITLITKVVCNTKCSSVTTARECSAFFTIKIKIVLIVSIWETQLNILVKRSKLKLVSLLCRRRRFRPASGKTSPGDSPCDACSPTSQSQSQPQPLTACSSLTHTTV